MFFCRLLNTKILSSPECSRKKYCSSALYCEALLENVQIWKFALVLVLTVNTSTLLLFSYDSAHTDMIHFFDADVAYVLFSVLVHSGGVHGGHYYAFIRPTLSDQWCVFISWVLVFYGTVCVIFCHEPQFWLWSDIKLENI